MAPQCQHTLKSPGAGGRDSASGAVSVDVDAPILAPQQGAMLEDL